MHVFTYGSLMFDRVWANVVTGDYGKVDGRLYGYVRRRIKGENYPGLVPSNEAEYVDGKIYMDVVYGDILRLDRFEGEYYQRIMEKCELSKGRWLTAGVYVLKKQYMNLLADEEWDPDWFSRVGIFSFLSGYKGFN